MPVDLAPEPMPSPVGPAVGLPHLARSPFKLVYHPKRWAFRNGKFYPVLKTVVLEVGVGGVDRNGDSTVADAGRFKRGEIEIPWSAMPAGGPPTYLQRYPARGGQYHCEVWEHPRYLADQVLPSDVDEAGRDAWLLWLVEQGYIPEITREAKELLREAARVEVRYLTGAAKGGSPIVLEELRVAQATLAALDAAIDPPKPAPAGKAAPRAST